ncbi:NADH-quinone oxidoreductase E subunit [Hasllibacter halocynthiae]|uniref:NADH-quinone oxidoreductase E subunit n=1 Tax=Hasllibacter halocynthiae TaxID=595589 RepID=A0A2T0X7X3_9RHOB|nr:NADH-quinone oxidoreductase E subunit [Hasllibacter halocynthiae]
MLRRLYHDQPEGFAFTPANQEWAEAQITKYPPGRQASAIIPLLWRAQEQEGWLSRPAIEHVCEMLDMAFIRGLEVATFYFMFQLQPVGRVAHVQVCGTTSCMICGAEDLIAVCKEEIAPRPHQLSASGDFSWEEVECLGACANAPMAQIGKDYYEDLTADILRDLLRRMAAGEVPQPGPQSARFASEPMMGLTSLGERDGERYDHNASVTLATEIGDTLKRIDGTEVPLSAPWRKPEPDGAAHPERDPLTSPGAGPSQAEGGAPGSGPEDEPEAAELSDAPVDGTHYRKGEGDAVSTARPRESEPAEAAQSGATAGDDPRVGRQAVVGAEPTVAETKPEDAGPVAEGLTGRDVPDGAETRGGVTTGNAAAADGPSGGVTPAEGDDEPAPVREPDRDRPAAHPAPDAEGDAGTEGPGPHGGADAPESVPETPPAETRRPLPTDEAPIGTRPSGLDEPREGGPDDLKRIGGIGPKLEAMLHDLGVYHFDQIAAWGPEEVAWMDRNLRGFQGRVTRDDWVGQARALAG